MVGACRGNFVGVPELIGNSGFGFWYRWGVWIARCELGRWARSGLAGDRLRLQVFSCGCGGEFCVFGM